MICVILFFFHSIVAICEKESPLLQQSNDKAVRVAVIGGGIGGAGFAFYLNSLVPNANVTVFERTNRVGGRIFNIDINDEGVLVPIETGTYRGKCLFCIDSKLCFINVNRWFDLGCSEFEFGKVCRATRNRQSCKENTREAYARCDRFVCRQWKARNRWRSAALRNVCVVATAHAGENHMAIRSRTIQCQIVVRQCVEQVLATLRELHGVRFGSADVRTCRSDSVHAAHFLFLSGKQRHFANLYRRIRFDSDTYQLQSRRKFHLGIRRTRDIGCCRRSALSSTERQSTNRRRTSQSKLLVAKYIGINKLLFKNKGVWCECSFGQ